MKIKRTFLTICLIFSMTTIFGQTKKINQDFIGYWSLEGFQTKMVIFQRGEKIDVVAIDWAYCNELETLEIVIISENELLISLKNPSNNFTTIARLEIVNSARLKKSNKGDSDAITFWNRIK